MVVQRWDDSSKSPKVCGEGILSLVTSREKLPASLP